MCEDKVAKARLQTGEEKPKRGRNPVPVDWNSHEFVLGQGPRRVAKALLTGFELEGGPIDIGPLTLRQADDRNKELLAHYGGAYEGHVIVELRYREAPDITSLYAEPLFLLDAVLIATQAVVDGWVGISLAQQLDEEGKLVGETGSNRTQVADSWHPGGVPRISADDQMRTRFLRASSRRSRNISGQRFEGSAERVPRSWRSPYSTS